MDKVSLDDYIKAYDIIRFFNNWHRKGQLHFNLLHRLRPDLADKIRGTEIDPFYLDERIPTYLTWITNNWHT